MADSTLCGRSKLNCFIPLVISVVFSAGTFFFSVIVGGLLVNSKKYVCPPQDYPDHVLKKSNDLCMMRGDANDVQPADHVLNESHRTTGIVLLSIAGLSLCITFGYFCCFCLIPLGINKLNSMRAERRRRRELAEREARREAERESQVEDNTLGLPSGAGIPPLFGAPMAVPVPQRLFLQPTLPIVPYFTPGYQTTQPLPLPPYLTPGYQATQPPLTTLPIAGFPTLREPQEQNQASSSGVPQLGLPATNGTITTNPEIQRGDPLII